MENAGKVLATVLIVAVWLVISIFCSALGAGAVIIIPLFIGMIFGIKAIWKKSTIDLENNSNENKEEINTDTDNNDDTVILQK